MPSTARQSRFALHKGAVKLPHAVGPIGQLALPRDDEQREDGLHPRRTQVVPEGRNQPNGDHYPPREQLMSNSHLLELLSLDRKTLAKPPDWNAPRQLELFGELLTCIFIGQQCFQLQFIIFLSFFVLNELEKTFCSGYSTTLFWDFNVFT